MTNHSLLSADRATHVKIVAMSILAAIVVVVVGIAARVADHGTETARLETRAPVVVKAGQPATFTRSDSTTLR